MDADSVAPALLARDTAADVERRQLAAFRNLSTVQKAELVAKCTHSTLDLALAGIRLRHPAASERERFLELAVLKLGQDAAAMLYPDLRPFPHSGR